MYSLGGFLSCLLLLTVNTFVAGFVNTPGLNNYTLKKGPLDTNWTSKVGTEPWPEYPRPLLQRSKWFNLNGIWQFQRTDPEGINNPPFGKTLAESVLVPFCLEGALSGQGIKDGGDRLDLNFYTWYRTTFDVPKEWDAGNRVLLNFGAVDYEATVFVNGKNVTKHTGGYWAFEIDVTDFLAKTGPNELLVHVYDPTDKDDIQIPIGKQTIKPSHIFYTPCTGIWQTVWIESAPQNYITDLQVSGDMHGNLTISLQTSDSNYVLGTSVWGPRWSNGKGDMSKRATQNVHITETHTAENVAQGQPFIFYMNIQPPYLWSPDSPALYNITITAGDDIVTSYVGFKTTSRGVIGDIQRPLHNGEFVFQFGPLDQGYWPDGIYTPPSKEAMIFDLKEMKNMGYNMIRKHIKVENPLWYQACDELGLFVIQDMPSLRIQVADKAFAGDCHWLQVGNNESTVEFGRQLEIMIPQLKSYTCISSWVIYNEAWGQPKNEPQWERGLTDTIKRLDPTRLVNTVTGWDDHLAGDFHDNHHYANPQCGTPFYSDKGTKYDKSRIAIQGEFGGIGHNLSIENLWNVPKAVEEIKNTYEIDEDLTVWNGRAHFLLEELRMQIEKYSCSSAVWTQVTDVEGEVNGMYSYDRRIRRPNVDQWNKDIQALYDTAKKRGTKPKL